MSNGAATKGVVLVVEDEPAIADVIRLNLTTAGYRAHLERNGLDGYRAVRDLHPAAVILDIGLPDLDGIEFCRRLRAAQDWTPVLFVTARDDESDRIVGLELGADDYITNPSSPRELVARLASVLRRTRGGLDPGAPLTVGDVVVDVTRRRVTVGGDDRALTATEFDLLSHLMSRPGQVFSREQLLSQVWGYAAAAGTRTVDVHVAQIRAKLGPATPIRTVRGYGYSAEDAT
ncbi:MAG: response regulator transcription factor [Mycobacteriales bacterium]